MGRVFCQQGLDMSHRLLWYVEIVVHGWRSGRVVKAE